MRTAPSFRPAFDWRSIKRARQDGFALPLTIYVLTMATILLAVGYARVSSEHRAALATDDYGEALAVAQAGLETYLGTVTFDACDAPIRPPDGDSVRINLIEGFADVVARVAQKPADTLKSWTYVVRSTGYLIQPTQGKDPQARRTVAQFAMWQQAAITTRAAVTAANGMDSPETDTSGEIRGRDQATPSECQRPMIPAVSVPSGGTPSFAQPDWTLEGSVSASGTGQQVANLTLVDWAATTGGGLKPDFTTLQTWNSSYPVMLITGDLTITASSQTNVYGTVIVTGDLTIQGSNQLQFYGILLVGGRIHFDAADQRVDGIIVSGLNLQQGSTPPTNKLRNGYIDLDYDSRHVRRALQSLVGFVPLQNAVVDNWATY